MNITKPNIINIIISSKISSFLAKGLSVIKSNLEVELWVDFKLFFIGLMETIFSFLIFVLPFPS